MQKKVMQVSFCDLHSAVVPSDIVRKYWRAVMVHRFCRPIFSGN